MGKKSIIPFGPQHPVLPEPIHLDLVIEDERVLKSTFTVSNVNTNPENTIYDIALHKVEMDCELRSEYVKWRLYKDII